MEIELKNGEKIILEVTSLFLEYIEDYEGGLEQLKKMQKDKKIKTDIQKQCMQLTKFICYNSIKL